MARYLHVFAMLLFVCGTITAGCGGLDNPDREPADRDECIDLDDDGRCDGVGDPLLAIQGGVVDGFASPHLCWHESIVGYTGQSCLGNFGDGTSNSWYDCVFEAERGTIDIVGDGEHEYDCVKTVDNGYAWCGNLRNADLDYCGDPDHKDSGSDACWANVHGNARPDPYIFLRDDNNFAVCWVVVDGILYPGFDDGTGEEGGGSNNGSDESDADTDADADSDVDSDTDSDTDSDADQALCISFDSGISEATIYYAHWSQWYWDDWFKGKPLLDQDVTPGT